jgi:hypothetical protein
LRLLSDTGQRQRLHQHNTGITCLFRRLRLGGKPPEMGADLGCTGRNGWCTSRPDQGRLETGWRKIQG